MKNSGGSNLRGMKPSDLLLVIFLIVPILWNYYGITRGINTMNRISNIFYDLSKIIVFVIFYLVLIKKDFRNIKFKIFMIIFSTINAISLIATQMSLGIDERILIFPLLFIITSFLVIKNFINFRKVNI